MKYAFVAAALVGTVFVAAPAAADCSDLATGGSVCTTIDYLYADASADQPGAGGARVAAYQLTVWGMTLTGAQADAYTADGAAAASAYTWCWDFDGEPGCEADETLVHLETAAAGADHVAVGTANGFVACTEGDHLGEPSCTTLP